MYKLVGILFLVFAQMTLFASHAAANKLPPQRFRSNEQHQTGWGRRSTMERSQGSWQLYHRSQPRNR